MRKLFYLAIAAALVYVVVYKVPGETKRQTLAAVGLADFFSQTLPGYLRSKFAIPENPVAKRRQLLEELSKAIGTVERELEAIVPTVTNGITIPKLPPPKEIQKRIEKTREFLAKSEETLRELGEANPKSGLLSRLGDRLLDRVLPPLPDSQAGGGGVGGDAGGSEPVCP